MKQPTNDTLPIEETMDTAEIRQRDDYIVEDYLSGQEVSEIARSFGLTGRRINQILKARGVELRPRKRVFEREPISALHERIGRMLYDYTFDRELQLNDVATQLGWGYHKVKKAVEGVEALELLDLLDIASLLKRPIGEIIQHERD